MYLPKVFWELTWLLQKRTSATGITVGQVKSDQKVTDVLQSWALDRQNIQGLKGSDFFEPKESRLNLHDGQIDKLKMIGAEYDYPSLLNTCVDFARTLPSASPKTTPWSYPSQLPRGSERFIPQPLRLTEVLGPTSHHGFLWVVLWSYPNPSVPQTNLMIQSTKWKLLCWF